MKALLFLPLVGFALGQICPPAEVLHPCTCHENFRYIECAQIEGSFNLKEILDNASSFVDDDVVFEFLTITETPLVEIEEGAIEHLKFMGIYIVHNKNLEYISPRAFNATRNVTTALDLEYNSLHNDPPQERDIFDVVGSFPNLEYVFLKGNKLSSIPDNAFQNQPLLLIALLNNNISRIGRNAFATAVRDIQHLDVMLEKNAIPNGGISEEAFNGMPSNVTVFGLEYNEFDFLEQMIFQPLLESAVKVTIGGETCNAIGECTVERFYCDERADWICGNRESYFGTLNGFKCKPEAGAEDIWEYCAGRNSTVHRIVT